MRKEKKVVSLESYTPEEEVTETADYSDLYEAISHLPEEELGYMYLNMDTYGGAAEFSDNSLAVGYVDIRQ